MYESYVTVIGNLTADPVLRTTKAGKPFATFRMASTPRRWDGRGQTYVDGGTNFVSVVTFNSLAANVVASLAKGQPAIVYGRLRVNTWSTAEGHNSASVEIDAYHVGHDLTWGHSHFTKAPRAQFDRTDRLATAEVQRALEEVAEEHREQAIGGGDPDHIEDTDWALASAETTVSETPEPDAQLALEAAATGPLVSFSTWSVPDPERDAYVVADAR